MNKSEKEFTDMLQACGMSSIEIAELTDVMVNSPMGMNGEELEVQVNGSLVIYEDDIPKKKRYSERWKREVEKKKSGV